MTFDNGGYPPGAKYDMSAPYNEYQEPEKSFDVVCSQTLSKNFSVLTTNYRHYEDQSEDGIDIWDDTSDTDWQQEFYENDYHDPLALIKLFKEFLDEQLKQGTIFKSPTFIKRLIEECEGWEETDFDVCKDK